MGALLQLDDRDLRQWEDHLPPALEVRRLALDEILPKVPGHYQEVVRVAAVRFGLRDDGDVCTWCVRAELVGVHLGDRRYLVGAQPTVLEDDVPLGRRAVPK